MHFNFFFSFLDVPWLCGILVPWSGIEPGSRQWKPRVLKLDRQGIPLNIYFKQLVFPSQRPWCSPEELVGWEVTVSYITEKTETSLLTPVSQIVPSISCFTKWVKFCMHFLKNYVSGKPTPDPKYFELHFYCGSLVLSVECFVEDSILWLGTFDISFTQSSWIELRACHCAELPAQESRVRRN